MSYVLTPIQSVAFPADRLLELWKPTENPVRSGTTKTFNGVYYALAYDNVRGRFGQTPAVADAGALGRTDQYMVFTFDVLRLHMDQECDDAWYVREKGSDQWYVVQGTAQTRFFRAKESTYKCARADEPPETSNAEPS